MEFSYDIPMLSSYNNGQELIKEDGFLNHAYLIPAVLAGFLQGIVEWLPVSSKTMITLFLTFLGVKVQNAYSLGLIANFGSFFAAAYYFRVEVVGVFKALAHPFSDAPYSKLLRFLFIGTLATGAVGVPLYITVRHAFSIVGGSVAMLFIGILLVGTGFVVRKKEVMAEHADSGSKEPNLPASILTGAMQGLAAIPGISRSGMTITPLLWMGFSAKEAVRLSFMLDVIALVGAGVVPLVIGHGGQQAVAGFGLTTTIIMIVVAAIISFFAIRGVLAFATRMRTSTVTFVIAGITIVVALLALTQL